jgi:hypothetical protein
MRVSIKNQSITSNQSFDKSTNQLFDKSFSIRRLIIRNSSSARAIESSIWSTRDVEINNLNLINIIESKTKIRSNLKYANLIYQNKLACDEEEIIKISKFYTALMIEIMISNEKNDESQIENFTNKKLHISDLSSSSSYWRAVQKHSHSNEFRKAAQIKFDAIDYRDTWEIVNRSERVKWAFTYKIDANGFLTKYNARIVMRDDLQTSSAQKIYAATLISKIFRMLMTLMSAYSLKTRQVDTINAVLNAKNDAMMYCHMSNEYKILRKIYKIIRALYEKRKSSLLWLRMFTQKCLKLDLIFIFKESCLFINMNDVLMLFFVNDVMFVFRADKREIIEKLISRLKEIFEFRNLRILKHFLDIRMLIKDEKSATESESVVYLV